MMIDAAILRRHIQRQLDFARDELSNVTVVCSAFTPNYVDVSTVGRIQSTISSLELILKALDGAIVEQGEP